MLVESAVGDAYGVGFEYADENLPKNTLEGYVKHPKHDLQPGQYSDDTQMSIAIAEAILEEIPWTKEDLAEKFVQVFKRDPRDAYSRGFQALLNEVSSGKELLAKINPDSSRSGAAMRAGPIGVFKNIDEILHKAKAQATITHNTQGGIASAQAAALMNHYFLYEKGPKEKLPDFLNQYVPMVDWKDDWGDKRVGSQGLDSVKAALWSIIKNDTLSGVLKTSISYSGDVDTVASIALSAASECPQIAFDIPNVLYSTLEPNSKYGLEFLTKLEVNLLYTYLEY